jgi:hypothetical protein
VQLRYAPRTFGNALPFAARRKAAAFVLVEVGARGGEFISGDVLFAPRAPGAGRPDAGGGGEPVSERCELEPGEPVRRRRPPR